MTEAEWLACDEPERLYEFVRSSLSDRQVRLAACAIIRCAPFHPDGRSVWDVSPEYSWFAPVQPGGKWYGFTARDAITASEKEADGTETVDEGEAAQIVGFGTLWCAESYTPLYTDTPIADCWPQYAAAKLVHDTTSETLSRLRSQLLRYRQVFRESHWADLHSQNGAVVCEIIREIKRNPFRPVSFNPAWRTDTAIALARGMYDSRDFGAMPILADALQDAGCEDEQVLNHCRDATAVHVRGCWVCDLVLGKV